MFFAPELMIVDCSALACFYQVKRKTAQYLQPFPLRSIFARFDTYLHPSDKSLYMLQIFMKSLAICMKSHKTFLSNFKNDATHLTCHF